MSARSIVISLLFLSLPAIAGIPCQDKVNIRHHARLQLRDCLDAWGRSGRLGIPKPSDDCAATLNEFVQKAKDVRTCRETLEGSKKPKAG